MNSIRFPHLHIVFGNVERSIEIYGFTIAYYGMVIALGILVALYFMSMEAKRLGIKDDSIVDVALATIISGIVGARIYYVVFSWDLYKDDLISIFNLRQGGLAIYGGIIFGALGMCLMSKKKGIKISLMSDITVMGVLIGQIMGRWGNFFNREAFGGYTDNLFAMQLPIESVRSRTDITDEMMEHITTIDGIDFISVHPTFLYESLYNLCVFILLFNLRKRKKWDGQIVCLYFLFYGLGRFFIESLRTDSLMLFGTNLAVSRVLSAIVFIAAAIVLVRKRVKV